LLFGLDTAQASPDGRAPARAKRRPCGGRRSGQRNRTPMYVCRQARGKQRISTRAATRRFALHAAPQHAAAWAFVHVASV